MHWIRVIKKLKKEDLETKRSLRVLGFDGEMGILLQWHELILILMFLFFMAYA